MSLSLFEKKKSSEVSRRTFEFTAQSDSYSINGIQRTVRLEVSSDVEFIDCDNSALMFNLVFTSADATTKITKFAGGSIIKNLRVKTKNGNLIGDEESNYNYLQRYLNDFQSSNDYSESFGKYMESANNTSTTYGVGAHQIEQSHKFVSGVLSTKKYYPAQLHRGFMIEFDLPLSANDLFFYDTTVPTSVSIENIRYECDLVRLQPNMEKAILDLAENNQLKVDFVGSNTYTESISANAGNHNVDIPGISGRMKSAHTYLVDTALATSVDPFEKRHMADLTSYRYRFNADYLNPSAVQVLGETKRARQLKELAKSLDMLHSAGKMNRLGSSTLSADQMAVFSIKVDKAQKNADMTISSARDKERNHLRVELVFDTAEASDLFTHILVDKSIVITDSGATISVDV